MQENALLEFMDAFSMTLKSGSFVTLTLSKPLSLKLSKGIRKIQVKEVKLENESQLRFEAFSKTQSFTSNHSFAEAFNKIEVALKDQFLIAFLRSSENEFQYRRNKKGNSILHKTILKNTIDQPKKEHDHIKREAAGDNRFLKATGILKNNGQVAKGQGDKLKQIRKFSEIIEGLIQSNFKSTKHINGYDMGSGKGYLTFSLYDTTKHKCNIDAHLTGIEARKDLVDFCNYTASELNYEGLRFEKGLIGDFEIEECDILMALHACDTATDDAIFKGIKANASLIIVAPCCHKALRKDVSFSNTLNGLLKHGIYKERQSEMLTDSIRALMLECHQYKTKVFEFIGLEHTSKNIMIVAEKRSREISTKKYEDELTQIKSLFGLDEYYLERLLR